tara:strand:+ start:572 stop:1660 length:1089 start_codon:yes stop_codon:yes gene_type:complete
MFGLTKKYILFALSILPFICFNKTLLSSNLLNSNETNNINKSLYILGPGDEIFLKIYDNDDFSRSLYILSDGTSTFPLIGNINISGLTIKNATEKLRKLYSNELLNPELSIEVKDPRPIRVSLIGEIKNPGIYSMDTSKNSRVDSEFIFTSGIPTVVDAIQKAGGISNNANIKNIKLMRKLPLNDDQGLEKYNVSYLNLNELLKEGTQSQNPPLFDGDIIKIPKVTINDNRTNYDLLSFNLSPKIIEVNVVGEVINPGKKKMLSKSSLSQAILSAGGLSKWGSNKKNVILYRINRNGSVQKKKFKFDLNAEISDSKNPILKDGDTILIGRTNTAGAINNISGFNLAIDTILKSITIFKLFDD